MAAPKKLSDDEISFFLGNMCPEADTAFRFAYVLYLNSDIAFEATQKAYRDALEEISSYRKNPDYAFELRLALIQSIWEGFESAKVAKPTAPIGEKLSAIDSDQRCIMVAIDVCGLKTQEASTLFGIDEHSLRDKLAAARSQLIELSS